jgi:hypothetical protein
LVAPSPDYRFLISIYSYSLHKHTQTKILIHGWLQSLKTRDSMIRRRASRRVGEQKGCWVNNTKLQLETSRRLARRPSAVGLCATAAAVQRRWQKLGTRSMHCYTGGSALRLDRSPYRPGGTRGAPRPGTGTAAALTWCTRRSCHSTATRVAPPSPGSPAPLLL